LQVASSFLFSKKKKRKKKFYTIPGKRELSKGINDTRAEEERYGL